MMSIWINLEFVIEVIDEIIDYDELTRNIVPYNKCVVNTVNLKTFPMIGVERTVASHLTY